ncbi:MAG: hypothetical protein K8L97_21220 [Anaerolineae bacterium]|nr:hypothetical protein [Anaerolineae bacterium]
MYESDEFDESSPYFLETGNSQLVTDNDDTDDNPPVAAKTCFRHRHRRRHRRHFPLNPLSFATIRAAAIAIAANSFPYLLKTHN